jgi:hypothetical protein
VTTRAEWSFLAIAVVLHVGALGAARKFPGLNPLSLDRAAAEPIEVEIPDLPAASIRPRESVLPNTESLPRPNDEVQRPLDPPRIGGQRPDSASATEPSSGNPDATDPGPQVAVPGGDSDWGAPGDGGSWAPPGLGKGAPIYNTAGMMADMGKAPAAPTAAPKTAAIDPRLPSDLINDAILKKDHELGLDLPAAGTVASALRSATLGSEAPGDARAQFVVSLGPGGKVLGVKFVSASAGSADTWARIAQAAKASLSAQKLALTERYSKGANITVNVQSKMQMPSGAKVDGGIELSLTQHFDVADIGAKPVRVVSAAANPTPVK